MRCKKIIAKIPSFGFILEKKQQKSLAQEVRQKSDISEPKSKG